MKDFWEPTGRPCLLDNRIDEWCSENVFLGCQQQMDSVELFLEQRDGDIEIMAVGLEYVDEDGIGKVFKKPFSLKDVMLLWLGDYEGMPAISDSQREDLQQRLDAWSEIDRAVRQKLDKCISKPRMER